ncbi:MAG TPA: CHAT domain-containing protein, partial [Pirellulales bacterium]|nr:CHAT domain-containing protein [Pirellulales bacterium]
VFPSDETPGVPTLPPGGLLITQVLPGGNAAQARLHPGDVLLNYAGAELRSVESLDKLIEKHARDDSIVITAWRDGETTDRDLAPGKLGVVLDRQPAPVSIAAKRKVDQMLLALTRGGDWAELPGSAIEVARLTHLVGDERTTGLTRSAASEPELERLRADGKLAEFRYLHFATHGEPNNSRSFESALILAQDQVSGEIPLGGGKYYDGRLTAKEVLATWDLNAELVTLSACESALGRPGGGDGVLGFAQAFLLAGSRAVCLSLWKVDDTATALLMDRFYQNLLGKRAGLAQPMPKAAALAEAKQWLRNLSMDEATKLAAEMTSGVARGKDETALSLVVPSTGPEGGKDGDHPFSHPRSWAGFILIGDPN